MHKKLRIRADRRSKHEQTENSINKNSKTMNKNALMPRHVGFVSKKMCKVHKKQKNALFCGVFYDFSCDIMEAGVHAEKEKRR